MTRQAKRETNAENTAKNVLADAVAIYAMGSAITPKKLGVIAVADYIYEEVIYDQLAGKDEVAASEKGEKKEEVDGYVFNTDSSDGLKNTIAEVVGNKTIGKGALLFIASKSGIQQFSPRQAAMIAGGGSMIREIYESWS